MKLIFGLAIVGFVGWKIISVFKANSFQEIDFQKNAFLFFSMIAILMFFNWAFEALKWKKLMKGLKPLSFKEAFNGVLAGISTGIITPNRIGNFIGRTALLSPDIRLKATLLTLLANLSQFIVTIFFGCLGLLLIGAEFLESYTYLLFLIGVFVFVFGLMVFINPQLVNRKPFNYFFSDRVVEGIRFISETDLKLKLHVILLSALRYIVFVSQYVLLLFAFSQNYSALLLFESITIVYLLMTLIPSLFFGKLFIREAAALFVLAAIGIPDSIILITGFLLWFINIALPSLAGASFLIRKK